jgi:antitoxin component YwqK of YwqJK toxin-antitoxin module
VRHGQGTLTLPDGSKIEGVWANDILDGEVKLYDKAGIYMKSAVFKNNKQIG